MDAYKKAQKKFRFSELSNKDEKKKRRNRESDIEKLLCDVIDLRKYETVKSEIYKNIEKVTYGVNGAFAFVLHDNPGFVVFPGAIPFEEQLDLIRSTWSEYLNYPANTNLDIHYGSLPSLWEASSKNYYLRKERLDKFQLNQESTDLPNHTLEENNSFEETWSISKSQTSASELLNKLRWISLGPRYDWTARNYDLSSEGYQVPQMLNSYFRYYGPLAMQLAKQSDPDPSMTADVAIINIYYKGHNLSGHIDDGEIDLRKPIVNISLGCPAIFLIGGQTKQTQPAAILLRTGDVAVMTGPSRLCYHGISYVFTKEMPDDIGVFKGCTDEKYKNFVQKILTARINISLRSLK